VLIIIITSDNTSLQPVLLSSAYDNYAISFNVCSCKLAITTGPDLRTVVQCENWLY